MEAPSSANSAPVSAKKLTLEERQKTPVDKESLASIIGDNLNVKVKDFDQITAWGGLQGLAEKLNTNLKDGLVPEETDAAKLEQRHEKFGANRFPQRPLKGFFELFFKAIQDRTLIILLVAAVVSIFLGVYVEQNPHGWIEGTAIIVAVLVVSGVTSGNDYSKERQFRKLNAVSEGKEIRVMRAGKQTQVSIYDIQVGDVVLLETGDKVCADGIVIRSDELKSDESSMTGETDPIKKEPNGDPFLLCGCQIMQGVGSMLVVAVGPNTQWGKIKALAERESEPTPLQHNLEELAESIGKLGVGAAAITFVVLLLQWAHHHLKQGHGLVLADFAELVEYIITAITIIVVAVPEGLPLAVTISLAYSMFQMMKDNNLVRHLAACETMGGSTCICSDKTGTLTENRMTVMKAWFAGMVSEGIPQNGIHINSPKTEELFIQAVAVNSTAYIDKEKNPERPEHIGSKTECALLEMINERMNQDYVELRKKFPAKKMFPFSSEKKTMTTIMDKTANGKYRRQIFTKGASEIILGRCSTVLDMQGNVVDITPMKSNAMDAINTMARGTLRTIGLAYIEKDQITEEDLKNPPALGYTLIGICGIMDPVRAAVPTAVTSCQKAGIKVRMLTGDNIDTAKNIAKECGIFKEGDIAIEGPDFRKLSNEQVDDIIPYLSVMARSSPEDKYRLVKRLRELGEVVAVTGDGTNDAPQLKEADVGFAMGIAGTEVAKDASDIILLDDNFTSIVKAVEWGRNVFDSIRKFVQFQVTVNVVAVVIAFVGAVFSGESPLKPVQMLWVNLIMDTMAALALATEPPTPELLDRQPYGRREKIITPTMWRNIIGQAIFQLAALFFLLYGVQKFPIFGLPANRARWTEEHNIIHTTIVFNSFVMCQLFNEVNSRKLGNELNVFKGILNNVTFLAVMAFTLSVQFLIVQFGGDFASTRALSRQQWIACIALGALSLPWGVVLRCIPIEWFVKPTVVAPKPKVKKQTSILDTLGKKKIAAEKTNWEISPDDLSKAVENRDKDRTAVIEKWGGIAGVVEKLGTHVTEGLSKVECVSGKRMEHFGVNKLPQRPPKTFFELFFTALQDKTLIILLVSAVVSIYLGVYVEQKAHGWIEGTAIIAAVLIVASVTAGNDYSKEKQFRKLNEVSEEKAIRVIRAGVQCQVPVYDIQVGDLVLLEVGDKICADGLVVSCDDLKCDESTMTGEPKLIHKDPIRDPWMICGCKVMEGRGTMMVIAVGPNSQWGKITALVKKEVKPTPLQEHLEALAESIGKLGLTAACITFAAMVIQWSMKYINGGHIFHFADLAELVEYVITAITIVVVAVPEGLPLAVTISLAYSMMKMMKDNNLVRQLAACETMGGATNICSDKTGTLTENRMTVMKAFIAGQFNDKVEGGVTASPAIQHLLAQSIGTNSTAYIDKVKNPQRPDHIGSKTECALLEFSEKVLNINYTQIRNEFKAKKMYPFSSEKKVMSVVLDTHKDIKGHRFFTKGASEIILDRCTFSMTPDGKTVPIASVRDEALKCINYMATQGLRTIGIAYADVDTVDETTLANPDPKYILISICGIMDPPRKEVPAAVKQCQNAGITVRMLTGDNIDTAISIAKACGILTEQMDPAECAIEGPKFRELSDEEVEKRIRNIRVMARSSPQDKYRLVKTLKKLGEVVAVTGDGTNDAPQLKEADVGFAMGIAGTEVAKEASAIILLDDNFSSIVKAVLWGRNVFDSIRKFVQFQVTVNVVAVAIAFVGAVFSGESPLKPVQMLWVNLIMDTMAALALATEPPTPDLLDRQPYGRREKIITPAMWRNIIGQAIFQLLALGFLLYGVEKVPIFGLPANRAYWTEEHNIIHTTIVFNSFVLCQLFNEVNSRKLGNELNSFSGIFTNITFLAVMAFTLSVQFLIVQFGGDFASTRPLSRKQWMGCIALAAISLPWGIVLRMIPASTNASQLTEEEVPKKEEKEESKEEKPRSFYDIIKEQVGQQTEQESSILWSFVTGFVLPVIAVYTVRTIFIALVVGIEVGYGRGEAFATKIQNLVAQ